MNFKQYTKYKLSKKEYDTLKELDNEFGEIFKKYWELCDQTDVANTFSEFKKFIADVLWEANKAGFMSDTEMKQWETEFGRF